MKTMSIIGWGMLLLAVGCNSNESENPFDNDGSAGDSDTDGDIDTEVDTDTEETGCPGRLQPLAPVDPVHTVGTGSASSCTEQALRDALDLINSQGKGTIVFNCGGPHTIALTAALYVQSSVEGLILVDGKGEITISGGGTTRVFDLENYTNFAVQRLTIADGFVAAGEPEEENTPPNSGAGIRHPWFGTLKVIDSRLQNNHCRSRDGEIGGGAIFAGGLTEVVLSGSVFVNNSASNGGALLNRGSTLTMVDCVFQANSALGVGEGQFGNGGGVYIDGMNYENPGGDLSVCGCRFKGNTAMTHGSGMFAYFYEGSAATVDRCEFDANRFGSPGSGSGALYHEAAPLTLRASTFANQVTAQHAGGLFLGSDSTADIVNCTFAGNAVTMNGGAIFNGSSEARITHCTFTGNSADYGPAIFKGEAAVMTLKNTVFGDNTTENEFSATSCHEPLQDGGGNLQWPETKNNGNPDTPCVEGIRFADPLLQPLAHNGGPTQTAGLGPGSPAIDLATDCVETDQRGLPRSSPCDSGAFETQ